MKKKILSLFLIVTIVFSSIYTSAFSTVATENNDNPIIMVESKCSAGNSSVDVNLTIINNPGIAGVKIKISYDSRLILTSVANGEAFANLDYTAPALLNPCYLNWDSLDRVAASDGIFAVLAFDVADGIDPGEKLAISCTYEDGDIYDTNLQNLNFDVVDGAVTVIDYIPGDANDDGTINGKDVTLIRRYNAGYDVVINKSASNVNDDNVINGKDVTLIRRYNAGYDVKLIPETPRVLHTMEHIPFKAPTCTEDGNAEYWHCTTCDKYFNDEAGTLKITPADAVIKAKGHTVVIDPGVEPTETSTGLTEGKHCSVCGEVITPQEVIPMLQKDEYRITYDAANGDAYLESQNIVNNNPMVYTSQKGAELSPLSVPGYTFDGWFDAPGASGVLVRSIAPGEIGNKQLFARWTLIEYDITYKSYKAPFPEVINEKYLHYTVNKGLNDFPNPEIRNYVFFGWYTDDGNEVESIPVGSTGDITLNGYWTSKRNLAKKVDHLEDPLVCTDIDNGVIYFAYEIGTIENIPLSQIWSINSVNGLSQQVSQTVTTTISTEYAEGVVNSISKSTVDSGTWTLSKDWNQCTHVDEAWAEQNGMTLEEAETQAKTSADTYSVTSSRGGSSTKSDNTGTTAIAYESKNDIIGAGLGLNAEISNRVNVGVEGGIEVIKGKVDVGLEMKAGGEVNCNAERNKHSGTDTTTIDTHVESNTSSWNNESSSSHTNTASESKTASKALSQLISHENSYGKSYSYGGSGSESLSFSSAKSKSVNSSSTLTYFTSQINATTKTYGTDGMSEGCYRLVIAGKAHVYGVVGYDVASKSYFTYTYSVLDDQTYEFLDYSPDMSFDDCEYGALPFEIPYFVYEYVVAKTAMTDGLQFKTNTSDGTATVISYSGTDSDVLIPTYYSAGGTYYKVTGISESAFAGKPIRSIMLGAYIDEIPASAFKNCTSLEEISGYFAMIGSEAFSGCATLKNFNVSSNITTIGPDAFVGVPMITVNVLNADHALKAAEKSNPSADDAQKNKLAIEITQNVINSAINSGAQKVVLNIASIIDGTELTFDVPELDYFELQGDVARSYKNLKLTSHADTTVLKNLTIIDCPRIPLEISSNNLTLDVVHVQSPSYVLLLSSENTNVTLVRDSRFESLSGDAVVWKNPVLISTITDGSVGTLDVSGNVYICGSIQGQDYLTVVNGEIIYISDAEFKKYIKGVFNVYFKPCGGIVGETSRMVAVGAPLGELPVPTLDYYTFDGWYTAAKGGTLVTSSTTMKTATDTTIYAHWKLKPLSGWVKASAIPAGAQVVNRKWTYDLTSYTTSSSPSLSGWTHYNTTSEWSAYGAWSGWSTSYVAASDSRQVETKQEPYQVHTGYNMTCYNTMTPSGARQFRNYSVNGNYGANGLSSTYGEYHYNRWASTSQVSSAATVASGAYTGACSYPGTNKSGTTGYILPEYDGSSVTYVWFIESNTYETKYTTYYRYRDRHMVYTYHFKKTEAKEATSYPSGSNISNIQEWVQYRAK